MQQTKPCVVLNYMILSCDDPDYEVRSRRYSRHVKRQNRKARRWSLRNRVFNLLFGSKP